MQTRREPSRARTSLSRPLASSLGATAASQALNVVTGVLLARVLGPSARGELAAVILWPNLIVAVGSTCVTEAVTYHAARREEPVSLLAGTALRLALGLALILTVVGAVVVTFALGRQHDDIRSDGYLFALNIAPALYALASMYLLNGMHDFAWFNALRVLVLAGNTAGLVALWAVDALTVRSATLVYLGSTILTAAVAAARRRSVTGKLGGYSRALAGRIVSFGLKGQLSTFSDILNERLDQLVISVALAPRELGLYVVAVTLATPASIVGPTVVYAALPVVAGEPTRERQATVARRYVQLAAGVSALIALPLAALAPVVLDAIFGSRYGSALASAEVLLAASVPLSTSRATGAVLKALGRPFDAGTTDTIGLLVTGVGLAALLPTVGILGAAITSVSAYTVSAGFALRRAARALGTSVLWLVLPSALSGSPPEAR